MSCSAVVICAGFGSRLGAGVRGVPKCLTEVCGKPILGHILDSLIENDVSEIVVVTGFLENEIELYVSKLNIPQVRTVSNSRFSETSTGYSFYLGMKTLRRPDVPLLLIEGDVVFGAELLEKITFRRGVVECLVDSSVVGVQGSVLEFDFETGSCLACHRGRRIDESRSRFKKLVNVSAVCSSLRSEFLLLLEESMEDSLTIEGFFNLCCSGQKIQLVGYDVVGSVWWEVDDRRDLIRANKLFLGR